MQGDACAARPAATRRRPHRRPTCRAETTTKGNGVEERRDTAILRLLIDTGMRKSELAELRLTDVDHVEQVVFVRGNGDRGRACPFRSNAAEALRRYERARARHSHAACPTTGSAVPGRSAARGIRQMVERRATGAGIERTHLHQFRHTFARDWLVSGGQEQ